jgi:hypothetical protein
MTLRALSRDPGATHERRAQDPRNWEVRLRPWEDRVGYVDDVLVDERGRACYFDIALEKPERHVLIPAGQAEPEPVDRIVWINGIGNEQLQRIPEYTHDPASVNRDYEGNLLTAYERTDDSVDYYDRPDFAASWGRGKNTTAAGRLARIDRLDEVDVAKADPDPRGWEVVGADGERLGKVHHLMGDLLAMRVRYLTVELENENREILVPVGHVHLDTRGKKVQVSILDRSGVMSAPVYDGGEITREHERAVTAFFEQAYGGDRKYDHPRYRYSGNPYE